MATTTYAIAAGSNRRGRHGDPAAEVRAALAMLPGVVAVAPIVASAPVGPSSRRFANTVALVASRDDPPAMLSRLKAIERALGRRSGRRWGARVIDLDVILWSGGTWADRTLVVPHVAWRDRGFVLGPLATLAPVWRDPLTGLTVRQLAARLTARPPAPRRTQDGRGP